MTSYIMLHNIKKPKAILTKCFVGLIIFLNLAKMAAVAVDDPLYRLTNALGYADREGNFSFWWDVSKKLKITKEIELPLRFHFNSDFHKGPVRSCLGLGWWFPLFETCLIAESESLVKFYTPGGGLEILEKVGDSNKYLSLDGSWEAIDKGNGIVKVSGPNKWMMQFSHGLIVQMGVNGKIIDWVREKERVKEIHVLGESKPLLEAKYDDEGRLLTLLYNNGTSTVCARYADLPVIVNTDIGSLIKDLQKSLSFVEEEGIEHGTFEWDYDIAAKIYKLKLSENTIGKKAKTEQFQWSAASNRLIQDPESTYDYQVANEAGDLRPVILRQFNNGEKEGYHFYPSSGKMWKLHRDKSIIETLYIMTPGSSLMSIRSMEITDARGVKREALRRYYSSDGALIKEVNTIGEVRKIMSGDGQLLKIETLSRDKHLIARSKEGFSISDKASGALIASYDNRGNQTARVLPNGWIEHIDYDSAGSNVQTHYSAPQKPVRNFQFSLEELLIK